MRGKGRRTSTTHAPSYNSQKTSSTVSLGSSQRPLPSQAARVWWTDCLRGHFFFLSTLSSLEICAWHSSPLDWVYLRFGPHSFDLLIFTLDPFVSFYFFFNCIIQSRIFIFFIFQIWSCFFFLPFFVDFQWFSILSFNQDFKFVDFFIDLVLIFLVVFPFNCFVKFIFIFNLALQSKTIHPHFFFLSNFILFYFLFFYDCFFFQSHPLTFNFLKFRNYGFSGFGASNQMIWVIGFIS